MDTSGALAFFQSKGWTQTQSAGIVANLYGESGWNPAAIGDGGLAYGLAQWHPDRQETFQQVIGRPIQGSSIQQQLTFVDWELRNSERKAGDILGQQSTLGGAVAAVTKYYERPANIVGEAKKRLGHAKALLGGALKKGGAIQDTARGIAEAIPGGSAVLGITDGLGLTGECDWLCQFKNWIRDSGFFQRLALAILAFIILFAAFYLMKGNLVSQFTSKLKGATNG